MTKTRHLREYVPYPVPRLFAALEFIEDIGVVAFLSLNEPG